MAPPLTFIVPTRERHDTLEWSLKTLVTQDCDDLEILVSDNASTDATREVVHSYDDPRIRYVNPGRRLGMSEHWEFALSHVEGGYVGFIGDDDGVMPGAAKALADLSTEHVDAVIWPQAIYYWPQFYDTSMANCLSMRPAQRGKLTWVDSREQLVRTAQFEQPHYLLPSPYWGLVSREVLDRVASRTGRVFHSITPDLFAGVAVAAVTSRYLKTDRIHALSGVSRHSNGASQLTGKDVGDPDSQSVLFESENALPFHPEVAYAANVAVLLAECLLQARDHVSDDVPMPDLARMIRAALHNPDFVLNPAVQQPVIQSLEATARRHGLQRELKHELALHDQRRWPRRLAVAARLIALGNPLYECGRAGVRNIYGATLIADRLRRSHGGAAGAVAFTSLGRLRKARRALPSARTRLG